MGDKDSLKAKLQGVRAALNALEIEHSKGTIDIGRYLQLKEEKETRKAELEQQLDSLAHGQESLAAAPIKEKSPALDLKQVLSSAVCIPLGTGAGCRYHISWPFVLPVCFRDPISAEYTYIVVGDGTDDLNCIVTEPPVPTFRIKRFQLKQTPYWYHLYSEKPLKSITFGSYPKVTDFTMIQAEFHPQGAWNISTIVVPSDRSRAYALGITEQLGSSIWSVSIDGEEYTFDQMEGCHFIEFVFETGKEPALSLRYKGPKEGEHWGIACAFFAF